MWVYVGRCSLPGEIARFLIKTTRESRCAADRWQVSTTSCETVQFSGADSVVVRCAGLCGVGMIPRWIPISLCLCLRRKRTSPELSDVLTSYWVYVIQGFQFVRHERFDLHAKQIEKRQNGSILEAIDFGPGTQCMPSCIQSTAWLLSKYVGTPQKTKQILSE